jgi:hypothetical protein
MVFEDGCRIKIVFKAEIIAHVKGRCNEKIAGVQV